MSPRDDTVILKLRNQQFRGWTSITIKRSIEAASAAFSLTVAERFSNIDQPLKVRSGDACEIFIGNDKLITGYVDAVHISHDANTHTIGVTGRSKTADLVDCSATNTPGQWKGAKLEVIASEMAAVYGVTVKALVDTGGPIPDFQLQQGETVYAAIERMARMESLLITDDPEGNLILTRAGEEGTATALVLGQNIKAGRGSFTSREQFSDYIVKGQHKGSDDASGATVAATKGRASDSSVKRTRTLLLVAEAQADDARCQARAQWEASSRAARGIQTEFVVQGWRQEDGALWPTNALVPVRDALLTVNGELLIATVEHSLSEAGTLTRLSVRPAGAFKKLPQLETQDVGGAEGVAEGIGALSDDAFFPDEDDGE